MAKRKAAKTTTQKIAATRKTAGKKKQPQKAKETPTRQRTTTEQTRRTRPKADRRDQLLADFETLRIPVSPEQLDHTLRRAEHEALAHIDFLSLLIGEQAAGRRQRSIERRIRDAHFQETKTLEDFDFQFNAPAIDRVQIEELASGEFIRRCENLVMVGQSGVGKSFLLQALGRRFCSLGLRVRYTTSANLLTDLTASLADQTLAKRLRYWSRFDLLIIDEFGFDRIERDECPQAANLLFKIIDARSGRSTALATNIDFDGWADYLGDPPLAMALLDRIVDGAIVLKIAGRSYRAHRSRKTPQPKSTID
jgi:DNA replication protein DnaC